MRLRFLIRLLPPEGEPREPFLRAIRSIAGTMGCDARNPKWTSYGALEMDIFPRSASDFQLFKAVVEPLAKVEFSKDLNEAAPPRSKEDVLREAAALFNEERFWECHEALEGVWRVSAGEEKSLLQGLILVCAAFVHEQKGERRVALGVARRALPQLVWGRNLYAGIDVSAIRGRMEAALRTGTLPTFSI